MAGVRLRARVAVQQIVDGGEFAVDPFFERYGVTFNVGGFLRRVR